MPNLLALERARLARPVRASGLVAALAAAALLGGCDTEQALLQQRLDLLRAEQSALEQLRTELAAGPAGFEGPDTVSVFLSRDLVNQVLAGADAVSMPVPGLKGATVTVRSLRADFRLGFPLVTVSAVARKEGLDAQLELVGVARLEPVIEPGSPSQLSLHVHVDSLVPRANWGPLDFAIGGFARDLLQVRLTEQARRVATIRIPVETSLPLKLGATRTEVAFTGARAAVSTPALAVAAKAAVTRVLPLPDGLHVYGKLTTGGAS